MKLRQKLAMVMAAAMIVTAVPVTTMAAQTSGLNKPAYTFIAETKVTTQAELAITVNYDEAIIGTEYVTVKAENFKFSEDDYKYIKANVSKYTDIADVNYVSETEVEFKLNPATDKKKFNLPLAGTPAKGTPTLTISGTSYTAPQKVVLGELESTKALGVSVDGATTIDLDGTGTIGKIVIDEKTKGAINGDVIEVKLPNSSDLIFEEGKVTLTSKKGLTIDGKTSVEVSAKYLESGTKKEDEKVLLVDLSTVAITGDRAGVLEISGIAVTAENPKEDVKAGDVNVTVKATKGDKTTLDAKELKVATVTEEDVTVSISEKDVVLTAGQGEKTVEIVVKESVDGSLARSLYLTLDGAEIVKFDDATAAEKAGFALDLDDQEITFKKDTTDTEHKVKVVIRAKADATGEVTLTAKGKDLAEDSTKEIAKVEAPFTVTSEGFVVEAGVKDQKGGKIVITEAKEGKFGRNQEFRIKSEDADLIIKGATVKTTGDVKVTDEVKDGEIIITVARTSDEASEIIISDIEVTAKKYLAEGDYDFLIGGTAASDKNVDDKTTTKDDATYNYKETVKAAKFVTTDDAQSVEIKEGPEVYLNEDNRMMAKLRVVAEAFGVDPSFAHVDGVGVITFFKDGNVVQFTNGSNIMNKNGVAIPMDTKTVIKEDGYTYVPARFLAEGLGLTVNWDEDTRVATFTSK